MNPSTKISFVPKSALGASTKAPLAKPAKTPKVSKTMGTLKNLPIKQYQVRQGKKVQIGV